MAQHRQNFQTWLAWLLALLAAASFAGRALADDQSYDMQIGDHVIKVNSKDARQGNVYVARKDTVKDDLVTRGGSITVDGVVQGDCAALGGSVSVNGKIDGDVAAFGGGVAVAESAAVGGQIASFGGSLDIKGSAGDDLACFGGSITLGPKAKVGGDVADMGGTVKKADGAKVEGEIKNLSFGMLDHFIPGAIQSAQPWQQQPRPAHRALGFVTALVVVAAIGFLVLLVSLFFPKNIERMSASIEGDFWTSAGAGMLIEIALGPALILMIVSILGIPLVPIAVLLLLGAVLMAYAAFGLTVFRKLTHAIDPARYSTIASIVLGYVLLNVLYLMASLLHIVPHLGFLTGLFLAINILVTWFGLTVGLGAVWRTRFGTRTETVAVPQPPAPVAPPAVPQPPASA
ncbi:MAG TPA: hypothetical protein VMF29_01400 [Candidatus Edwardsbacteria bacterium]|nr:hypothetical protein [Candidatus Edwardsbacteria bacterium]